MFLYLSSKCSFFLTPSAHGVCWIWKLQVLTAERDQPVLSVLHPDAGSLLQDERRPRWCEWCQQYSCCWDRCRNFVVLGTHSTRLMFANGSSCGLYSLASLTDSSQSILPHCLACTCRYLKGMRRSISDVQNSVRKNKPQLSISFSYIDRKAWTWNREQQSRVCGVDAS